MGRGSGDSSVPVEVMGKQEKSEGKTKRGWKEAESNKKETKE